MIPIFEPLLQGNEKKYVAQCLETGWISSQGEFITKFEEQFAAYHGMKQAIVTSNCTTALHISLKALGIGYGDEVICPDLTFIAPANMIVLSGAKLVLVDIDPQTLAIDPTQLESKITDRTKAIIVVHQFGHAAPMDEIMAIAAKHRLRIIEDNAESLGGKYKGKLLGTIGDISCSSFFANKIITSGEGGAILTNDGEIAEKCRIFRDHGMSRQVRYKHVDLGYNYRMTNMQAAVGLAQLERLDEILTLRKDQMELYYKLLDNVPGITLRPFQDWCEPVHWLMTLTLDKKYNRDEFLQYMKTQDIDCRQMINPVHRADHFANEYDDADFPNAIRISTQSAHLPCSTHLREEQIEHIANNVKDFLSDF
jgi:perosamine synthetase